MILHSEAGSGKTLSYLMPILNALYDSETDVEDTRFKMSQANEDQMFQNADEMFHRQKRLKNNEVAEMKGALVLTSTKELVSQIYKQGRLLDETNCIRFNRLTSSL